MPTDNAPKGFDCTTCKTHHEFGTYVAAHWTVRLTHTCSTCGAVHDVFQGRAVQTKRGKTSKTA